jgi:murein DD-endopeptidase MepM/ murein hydrolase activator NlpD
VHQGVDLFASVGTPVFAVGDGRITHQRADFPGSLGGNQLWLTTTDGSRYFYGHLSGFAKGVGAGSPVHAGNVIGYVGATGLTTVPHLHFEIHPGGGAPVNPYPVLKAMVNC